MALPEYHRLYAVNGNVSHSLFYTCGSGACVCVCTRLYASACVWCVYLLWYAPF